MKSDYRPDLGELPDNEEDLRAEFGPRKRKVVRCHDRMCGAEDCPNCHPENFTGADTFTDYQLRGGL